MRIILTVTAIVSVASVNPVWSQYLPYPVAPGYPIASTSPQVAPGPTLGREAPGYQWRSQRSGTDWRNNTWRERLQSDVTRDNTWREQRTIEDWRQREDYAKNKTKNNATDRGYIECGSGSIGSSIPCRDYAKENRYKIQTIEQGYSECSANSVVETCRRPKDTRDSEIPVRANKPATSQNEIDKKN